MADMTCPKCDTTLIRVERKPAASAAGILSGFVIFIGLVSMLFNILIGILIIIVGAIIGLVNDKTIWMTCPKCNKDIVKLS